MAAWSPTSEQAAAVDAFRSGGDMLLRAGAGSGKTSTLRLLADAAGPRRRGLYLAYNRSVAEDAKRRFPRSVRCSTAHALAFQAGGRHFAQRLRAPRQPARVTAKLLGLTQPLRVADTLAPLSPEQLARIVMATVQRFCWSADPAPAAPHVPRQTGADDDEAHKVIVSVALPAAHRAWEDLSRVDGQLRFSHDHYLKAWQLRRPELDVDYVLLDEAQDANPVVAAVVAAFCGQRVVVGDQAQAIYGWRGAVDFMATFPARHRLALSRSFRFGPVIATEANKWLSVLRTDLRLSGLDSIPSRLAKLAHSDAVLTRTNAEAVAELLAAHEAGIAVALVGGGSDICRIAEAALELQQTGRTTHPELCMFVSWDQLRDYVDQDHAGAELKAAVKLIDNYGAKVVVAAVNRSVAEAAAQRVISTAHKAKGREWDTVRIASDFSPPNDDDHVSRPEAMLAYVAVTRAREALDRGSLDWVDQFVDETPNPAAPATAAPTRSDGHCPEQASVIARVMAALRASHARAAAEGAGYDEAALRADALNILAAAGEQPPQ